MKHSAARAVKWGALALALNFSSPTHADEPETLPATPAPECLPNTPAYRNAPIGAVYLHGLFIPAGTDVYGFRALELQNRATLETLANQYHVRIALPVGVVGSGGFAQWNPLTLANIEQLATQACGGAKLAHGRVMIGFSNGAEKSGQVCNAATDYSKVLVLGPPTATPPCPRVVIEVPHHALPYASIDQALANLHLTAAR